MRLAKAGALVFLLGVAPAACADTSPPEGSSSAPSALPSETPPGEPTPAADGALIGTWYLDRDGVRARAVLTWSASAGAFSGTITDENGGAHESIDHVAWNGATGALAIRTDRRWIRGRVVDGVFVGRFAEGVTRGGGPAPGAFERHITGWHEEAFSHSLFPRAFELLLGGQKRARVRVDATARGELVGTMKVYADVSTGAQGEEDEYDLDAVSWDGKKLRFATHGPGHERVYAGDVEGRFIHGSYTESGGAGEVSFTGARGEVLGFGLATRAPGDRAIWQARTRRQLKQLMMAGDPAPLSRTVTVIVGDAPPVASKMLAPDRDDDPNARPQAYQLTELYLDHTLPNPYGGPPLTRRSHGQLFVPTSAPPPGGFPAVVALNGHTGSARRMTNPDDEKYWFGDGYARRGFVVLAIDVSHRPLEDRRGLYGDFLQGDNPAGGNGTHPAIKAPGFDSDWEEDGERAWDAMRGIDYLRSLHEVNPARVMVTGHSMGGEVTTFVAALDESVPIAVASAPPQDFGVMLYAGNHPCWRWLNADIREYIEFSDLHALTAPRAFILETGKTDGIYSARAEPWAGAKQSARRARAAYGDDSAAFLHYLHYDQHHYHAGDVDPSKSIETGVRIPVLLAPASPWSLAWQTDGATATDGRTIFDIIAMGAAN